jgi:glutathionyl-hydroquinone reductase
MRALKGLDDMVSLSVVHWLMGDQGWSFEPGEGVIGDPLLDAGYLHEVYAAAEPGYTGRVTVPVLWDKERATIVNNESPRSSACSILPSTAPALSPETTIPKR